MTEAISFEEFSGLVPVCGLRPENQRDLFRKLSPRTVKSGDFLFRAGDQNQESLFLLDGEIAFEDDSGRTVKSLRADSDGAKHRIAHQSPRSISARCIGPVTVIAIDNALLDVLLAWDQTGSFEVHELSSSDAATDTDDWMTRLLQLPAFQMIPAGNLQTLFMRLESIEVKAGQVIVQQGDVGDFFYVIDRGQCLVTRESPSHPKPIKLAVLEAGMSFGEEALIADTKRNATVTMMTDGCLLRLSKDDFRSLLRDSITRQVSKPEADTLIAESGVELIDVRLPSEYKLRHLDTAINLPLYLLRMKLQTLSKDKAYIVYCDSGRRSSVAAFILTQKGFDVRVLDSDALNTATT